MPEPVKRRRSYESQRRRQQADETRVAIMKAARDVFIEQGYGATTMAAIATRAGVAVETVYSAAGTKPVLLRTLIDMALAGGQEPLPASERDYVQQIRQEPSAGRKLEIYAAALGNLQARVAPLFLVLRAAAPANADAKALWQSIVERRAANMHLLAEELGAGRGLQQGVTVDEAADVLWAFTAPELYDLLVTQRGWSLERFSGWLANTWKRLLLPE